MGLNDDFISMSFQRRNLKTPEEINAYDPVYYIIEAQKVVERNWRGPPPKVFVVTDDCRIMKRLREVRQSWVFVSECDEIAKDEDDIGYDWKNTTSDFDGEKQRDDEYFKNEFIKLYGVATSKFHFGVSYSDNAWWEFFMRPDRISHTIIHGDAYHPSEWTFNAWR